MVERHKARHVVKDSLAGGAGLGILHTRRKTISGMQITETPCPIPRAELDGLDGGGVQPTTFTPALPRNDGTASDAANQTHFREGQPSHDSPMVPGSSLDPTNITNGGSPIVDTCELGSMYYDASFDLVHFDVMGFNGSPLDVSPGFMHMAERDEENRQPGESPLTPYSPRSMEWTGFASNNHTTRHVELLAMDKPTVGRFISRTRH